MRESFDRIKLKYTRLAAVYAACGGVLCALAVTGVLLLVFKLCAIALGWYIYLVIGVLVAAAAGAALFFILRPSDLKLAKKLDKTFGLDEKAQTMIEYGGCQGAMYDMQRADTEAALKTLPKRKIGVWEVLSKIIAVLIAAAIFAAGLAVGQKSKQTVISETPYTVDEWRITALNDLITEIEADGNLDADIQVLINEELASLLADISEDEEQEGGTAALTRASLAKTITQSYVEERVQDAMYAISDISIAANTYDNFAYSISLTDISYIADAIRNSASAYTAINSTLSSYDTLSTINGNLLSTIADKYMEPAGDTFTAAVEELTDDTFASAMAVYSSALYAALYSDGLSGYRDTVIDGLGSTDKFGNDRTVDSGDDLYNAVYDVYSSIKKCTDRYENGIYTVDRAKRDLAGEGDADGAIYSFVSSAATAMQVQAYTYMADIYIRQTLGSIFDVDVVGSTIQDGAGNSSSSGGDEAGGGTSGGGGHGDNIYPNQDLIYDPETGEYDYYYYLLNNSGYLDGLYELLSSDDISDEMKSYILSYITSLLTTTE